jgi:hypothetical protein
MWTIIKVDQKKIDIFKKDIYIKFNSNTEIYSPKILSSSILNSKKIKEKEINLLGSYIFCYNKNFNEKNTFLKLYYTRGLKSVLNGCSKSQEEIKKFIQKCKDSEGRDGYILPNFFDLEISKNYKFLSGPFLGMIFEIISLQKNKLNILLGNKKTLIRKNEYAFNAC